MHFPTDRIAHTTACDISVVWHWFEWEKPSQRMGLEGWFDPCATSTRGRHSTTELDPIHVPPENS